MNIYLTVRAYAYMNDWHSNEDFQACIGMCVRVFVKVMIQKDPSAVWQRSVLSGETGWQLHVYTERNNSRWYIIWYTQYDVWKLLTGRPNCLLWYTKPMWQFVFEGWHNIHHSFSKRPVGWNKEEIAFSQQNGTKGMEIILLSWSECFHN